MIQNFHFGWLDLKNIKITNKGYDWVSAKGNICRFKYYELEGFFIILDVWTQDGNSYLKIQYEEKEPYTLMSSNFKLGKWFNYLNKYRPYKFHINIGDTIKDDKRDMTIIDQEVRIKQKKQNGKYYNKNIEYDKYHCNVCTNEDWMSYQDLKHGIGCNVCNGNKVVKVGINDIPTTDPWMIDFFPNGYEQAKLYSKGSNKKIYPKCPDCGRIKNKKMAITTIYSRQSIGCDCSDNISYPNKFAYAFLDQLPIKNRKKEFSPDWLKPYLYDNYFEYNNIKYVLEMDGGLGHGNSTWDHEKDTIGIEIDKYKDSLAREHDIIVIRIDCKESKMDYVKNNIKKSLLNDIFDLSMIDWLKCDEFAINNLVKELCLYYEANNYPEYKEIKKVFPISTTETITKYIEIGSKHGWCKNKEQQKLDKIKNMCEYYENNNCPKNHELARIFRIGYDKVPEYLEYGEKQGWCTFRKDINIQRAHIRHRTQINIYDKNNNFILSYLGVNEFVEKANKLLNITVSYSQLCRALKSGNLYKGYYFRYTETN